MLLFLFLLIFTAEIRSFAKLFKKPPQSQSQSQRPQESIIGMQYGPNAGGNFVAIAPQQPVVQPIPSMVQNVGQYQDQIMQMRGQPQFQPQPFSVGANSFEEEQVQKKPSEPKSEADRSLDSLKEQLQQQFEILKQYQEQQIKKKLARERSEETNTSDSVDSIENTKLEAAIIDPIKDTSPQRVKLLFDETNLILNNVLTNSDVEQINVAVNINQVLDIIQRGFASFKRSIKRRKIRFKSPLMLNALKRTGRLRAYLDAKKVVDRFLLLKSAIKEAVKDDMLDRRFLRLKRDSLSFDRSISKQVDLTNLVNAQERLSSLTATRPYLWSSLYNDFEEGNNEILYIFDSKKGCDDLFKIEEENQDG